MFKSILTLSSGVGVSKLVGVIILPILARLYAPEDFGTYASLVAAISILLPLATSMLEVAIPVPKNDRLAFGLSLIALVNLTLFSTVLLGILHILDGLLEGVLRFGENSVVIYLLPVGVFAIGCFEVTQQVLTRVKMFKRAAIMIGLAGLISSFSKLLFYFIFNNSTAMILAYFFSNLLVVFLFFHKSIRLSLVKGYIDFIRKKYFKILCLFRDVVFYRLPSQIVLRLAIHSPVLFISYKYAIEESGQFSLALTVLALPMALLGQAVGKVYYAEVAKIGRKYPERIRKVTRYIISRMFIISIFPFLVLFFYGEELFSIVFGEEWSLAGEMASSLSIFLLSQLISTPIINVIAVLKKEKILLYLNFLRLALIFLVFGYVMNFEVDVLTMINYYGWSLSFFYFLSSYYIYSSIK